MLRATADGLELYLAFEVLGDYAELLRRVVRGQFFCGGQPIQPSLVPFRRFETQGAALVA